MGISRIQVRETGSIRTASATIQSRIPVNCRDMRRVPANGGLFYLHAESPVFHTENDAGLGGLSPQRKFPFLTPEKCAPANFPL
jgi:hypothetical protein